MDRPPLTLPRRLDPLRRFLASEDGPTAVEYAVMLALVLVAVIAGIMTVGGSTGGMYGDIQSSLSSHGM